MNPRVLEIIKDHSEITHSDLALLQSELQLYPYAQSLRAAHLIGIQMFDNENFKKYLSEVAAYTADKKNLYKILHPQPKQEVEVNENQPDNMKEERQEETFILDEFRQDENIKDANSSEVITAPKEVFSEEIIADEKIFEEQKPMENAENISFHGVDDFLPAVKFNTSKPLETAPPQQKSTSKAEDEMQRLIAEVEAKMKLKSAQKKDMPEEEFAQNSADIDFYESAPLPAPIDSKPNEDFVQVEEVEVLKDWKPISFGNAEPACETAQEGENLTKTEASESMHKAEEHLGFSEDKSETGNVGKFINTWQAWLQLGKSTTQNTETEVVDVPEQPTDKKTAAIENFIENEPKISKLRKEEFPAAKKERGDNISHLMTETLAKIYTEQKLYGKATEAYEILKKKFPERAADFDVKINEIKELRQNIK